ncbi:unnamed protein product [Pleuronectes platessa]|uniref:Uncharacterized protein n=1 Tax=Pleuronectes platessa TaxID=8262 RepID=A0A9N7V856_PLEPL|nr:unnamed protein product [Pleuronectes platessa]
MVEVVTVTVSPGEEDAPTEGQPRSCPRMDAMAREAEPALFTSGGPTVELTASCSRSDSSTPRGPTETTHRGLTRKLSRWRSTGKSSPSSSSRITLPARQRTLRRSATPGTCTAEKKNMLQPSRLYPGSSPAFTLLPPHESQSRRPQRTMAGKLTAAQGTGILLVTANVGSLFEDPNLNTSTLTRRTHGALSQP